MLHFQNYKNKDAFLITSCLSDSSPDQFWEKVIQHKVKTIVSINDSEDDNEVRIIVVKYIVKFVSIYVSINSHLAM